MNASADLRSGTRRVRLGRALVAILAAAGLQLPASNASSHALLQAAEPKPGATLDVSPEVVTLSFTEEPEVDLSSIRVVEQSGAVSLEGKPVPSADDPRTVTFPIEGALPQGVYTVTWRVLSTVDGHITAGTLQWGVGVPPLLGTGQDIAGTQGQARPVSPLEVGSRWGFIAGILLLLGGAWVALVAFRGVPAGVWWLLLGGLMIALLAVVGLASALGSGADVGPVAYLGTGAGRMLVLALGGVGVAAAGLVLARAVRGGRSMALVIVVLGAAVALVANVAAGHAAGAEPAGANIAAQSVHFAAAAVWIGGLAALLLGIRGAPGAGKASAVRRFSTSAAVALGVVVVTGTVRAVNQLDRWGDLVATGYGRAILAKIGLLVALAALGAVNRYRNVPRTEWSLDALRRVSAAELSVSAVVLVATALLVTLPPPYGDGPEHAQVAEVRSVMAEGTDDAGEVLAMLEISPGTAGPNRFTLRLTEVPEEQPLPAEQVQLEFSPLDLERPADGTPLPLEPQEPGTFGALGANIGAEGHWKITAVVRWDGRELRIPLIVATPCEAERIGTEAPAVYDVPLSGPASVQALLGRIGRDRYEVHFTFLAPDGAELQMEDGRIWRWLHGEGDPEELEARRLGPGHFVARTRLEAGAWRFQVASDERGGGSHRACFEERIQG